MHAPLVFWFVFNALVLLALLIDLGVFHRGRRAMGIRAALGWTFFWALLAACFAFWLWHSAGRQPALEFATGYITELSLSVDNLFLFLLIFNYFKVPAELQHGVLFWGIIGALITRGLFIFAGVELLARLHWIIYLFGAFLVLTGAHLAWKGERQVHPETNPVVKLFRRIFPVTGDYGDGKFFARREGRRWATPLLVALIVVETTDVIFATDSIPAVLAITRDAFIVYACNVFAILGLRSLYFALAAAMRSLRLLHYGIAAILIFVGFKMAAAPCIAISTTIALITIAAIVAITVLLSLALAERKR